MPLANNYPNPLDNFRSHSYHFILTVASSTEAFRKLIERGFLPSVNRANLGEQLDLDGEQAYLLADTRRFSQYQITKLETQQMYGTGDTTNPAVPASSITMRMLDTTGLTFFNFLMETMQDRLQSAKASAFFMLAIVFTGHNDDNPNRTETIAQTFIPMVMTSLGFDFNSSGSTIDMTFFETEGNPGAGISEIVSLSDVSTISTEKKNNTIGAMVQALEDRLNQSSLTFFHKYTNAATSQANTYSQAGKLVQYMITIPKEWENFQINTASKSANIEQQFIARQHAKVQESTAASTAGGTDAKARDSYASFPVHTTIQDALMIILDSSKEYLDLASTAKMRAGEAVVPTIVSQITSDATTYLIHIDVYATEYHKMSVKNGEVKTRPKNEMDDGQIRNLLTYDYIFTGRNSHILDLKIEFEPYSAAQLTDIDLNMGATRLADNASAGQSTNQAEKAADNGVMETRQYNPMMKPNEPVFQRTKTSAEASNFAGQNVEEMGGVQARAHLKAKQEHITTMANLHFMGSLSLDMVIRGNPHLLQKYADRNTRGGIPRHTLVMRTDDLRAGITGRAEDFFNNSVRGKVFDGKQEYYKSFVAPRQQQKYNGPDPILHGSDITTAPLYAKINIAAPNVDYTGNQIAGQPMFTSKFFYQGTYMVKIITHTFENGEFKQILSLIPNDMDGEFSNATSAISNGSKFSTPR